jgi:beta-galactosidase
MHPNIHRACLPLIAAVVGLSLAACAAPSSETPRSRESFDQGWRFARFGSMPDGSKKAEPGAASWTFQASASSEQGGNVAERAVDGDTATRWCASSEADAQWLQIDLGSARALGSVTVQWESASAYKFVVEGGADGRTWKTLADRSQGGEASQTVKVPVSGTARFLRIRTTSLPKGCWASICEIAIADAQGKAIENKKVASAGSPENPAFDDSGWRRLSLPHDWGIEGPFRMDLPNETGKLPWAGIGWYRKTVTFPESLRGRKLYLDFDGAMAQPKIFVNGQFAGEWKFGYASFRVDITPFVKFGQPNSVAVRLENLPDSTRWYPGGGIYRHVWLVAAQPVHVAHNGVYVTTPAVSADSATVAVETTIENSSDKDCAATVVQEILDGGKVVATQSGELSAAAGQTAAGKLEIVLPKPALWDAATPHLYTLRTTVKAGGAAVDQVETRFGVRTIQWDAQKGFLLNGRRLEIKGVCQHHDLGALGSAVNRRALQRQIEILKGMGCNAIRTSHNPPAPELLDLCDEMGMVVMDELFDVWKLQKYGKANCYNIFWDNWHERDVRNFVTRDRNHPSVILWSLGNEVAEFGNTGFHWVPEKLYGLFRKYDTTRPVSAGCNHPDACANGFQRYVDVFGLNYHLGRYAGVANALPDKPLVASETASCVSSRGEYFFDDSRKAGPVDWNQGRGFYNFQVSSYGLYAPGWAYRPDLQFEAFDKNPRYAGEFIWTGFDYLGEPTPYNMDETNALNFKSAEERKKAMEELKRLGNRAPSRSSYFGVIDLAGFPKDLYYLYQSRWRPELPMAHLLPHWNWPERNGLLTPVHVFTSGDEAELFLNGKSLGRKKKGQFEYRLHWDDVRYQPGTLKVVAYKDGKEWATDTVKTTGPAAKLALEADRAAIAADGSDLCFITVRVADAGGLTVPRSMNQLAFTVEGPGEIVATDNGNAVSFEPFQLPTRKAFNGLALVIVRFKPGQSGSFTVKATSPGLAGAAVKVSAATR